MIRDNCSDKVCNLEMALTRAWAGCLNTGGHDLLKYASHSAQNLIDNNFTAGTWGDN